MTFEEQIEAEQTQEDKDVLDLFKKEISCLTREQKIAYFEAMLSDDSEEENDIQDQDDSPNCNCGTCYDGNYTCIRND